MPVPPASRERDAAPDIGPILASQLAIEFASLRAPGNCPTGIYVVPTVESLGRWAGVFFVHRGPYAGAILRFALVFPRQYPRVRPQVFFESDVFHPMVDPKTREWHPHGKLAQWKPHVDHVANLLHELKASFKSPSLEACKESDAINKQVWSMYHHSLQTFLSLTAQRARQTSTRHTLFDEPDSRRGAAPASAHVPTAPASPQVGRQRDDQLIRFTELDDPAVQRLWADLRRSLGER
ncbi:hypothetical protein CspeluHIS016_0109580 [Cutaneotrichosporon spelunceum]|uniref:UBC core domain-containing protein n=1 Tax=Cutaneotrichosporon spelunceum TaxID=1672016 RepID=A0AAD3TPY3_9TREE|nr:hypothetical protein CspeluHIS016_0109580 [Cutaneotrichosporon spelunceum]